jgi:hypothetical protein
MLVYALYALVLVLVVAAAWFAWHRLHGRKPPEVEEGKGPPPPERDERWDPRRRYGR